MGNQQTLGCSGGNTAASNPATGPLHSGSSSINDPNVKQAGGVITTTALGAKKKPKSLREKNRFGTVIVKVASLSSNRRVQERQNIFTITPRGALFHGTQCNPALVQKVLQSAEFSVLPPVEISLGDSRAHKLLVVHTNGWHAIPAPETFSRHSGTCVILGDRNNPGLPFSIKLGDCFRLGSVGLVVSELRTADGEEQRLDSRMLQYLKDEALEFDTTDEMAALAADEEKAGPAKSVSVRLPGSEAKLGIANGEKFICYMCYETHDTAEDPLVAPCDCKGDTRYLHVQCLQKWYHSSICGPTARVIRTTGNGAPACKICGTAYKTAFKRPDGRTANLLEMETAGPYLSLVVVTRHDTNPGLFNTKFRLNFGRMANSPVEDTTDLAAQPNALIIGRSSSCSMVLDYRTVSTVHAILYYNEGRFFLQDKRSSNGTMVYLQEPLELPFSHPVRLRMGRSTLSIQAKRNWMTSVRGAFGTIRSTNTHPTPEELMNVFSLSNMSASGRDGGQAVLAGLSSMQSNGPGISIGGGPGSLPQLASQSSGGSPYSTGVIITNPSRGSLVTSLPYDNSPGNSPNLANLPRRAAAMVISSPGGYSESSALGEEGEESASRRGSGSAGRGVNPKPVGVVGGGMGSGSGTGELLGKFNRMFAQERGAPILMSNQNQSHAVDQFVPLSVCPSEDIADRVPESRKYEESNEISPRVPPKQLKTDEPSLVYSFDNEAMRDSLGGPPRTRPGHYSPHTVHGTGNIVLTDGAMADMEGSSHLMARQYVEDIVRTSSPSPSRPMRTGCLSSGNLASDSDFSKALTALSGYRQESTPKVCESAADSASLSMVPPAAVAFSTPHSSGKNPGDSNGNSPRDFGYTGSTGSIHLLQGHLLFQELEGKNGSQESGISGSGATASEGRRIVSAYSNGLRVFQDEETRIACTTPEYRAISAGSKRNSSSSSSSSCSQNSATAALKVSNTISALVTPVSSRGTEREQGDLKSPGVMGRKGTSGDGDERGAFSPYLSGHRKSFQALTQDNREKDKEKETKRFGTNPEEILTSSLGRRVSRNQPSAFSSPLEDTVRVRSNSDSTISEPDRRNDSTGEGIDTPDEGTGDEMESATDASENCVSQPVRKRSGN